MTAHLYYVAHSDDAALWMEFDIANRVLGGDDVYEVTLTTHEGSAMLPLMNGTAGTCPIHSVTHSFGWDQATFFGFFHGEMVRSAAVVGSMVLTRDDRMKGGGAYSAYVERVIMEMEAEYGPAVHHTMSYVDYHHPDHRATGWGLRALVLNGRLDTSQAVFHYRSDEPTFGSLPGTLVEEAVQGAEALAIAAITEETVWDPDEGKYALGYHSVKSIFDAQIASPTNKTHTAAQQAVARSHPYC